MASVSQTEREKMKKGRKCEIGRQGQEPGLEEQRQDDNMTPALQTDRERGPSLLPNTRNL